MYNLWSIIILINWRPLHEIGLLEHHLIILFIFIIKWSVIDHIMCWLKRWQPFTQKNVSTFYLTSVQMAATSVVSSFLTAHLEYKCTTVWNILRPNHLLIVQQLEITHSSGSHMCPSFNHNDFICRPRKWISGAYDNTHVARQHQLS